MQLVPKQLAEVLSQDIDITNPQAQELLITNLMENIVQSEDLFPAEMADKYIWIFNMFDKEKAYWQDKYMLAARYVEAFEKMEERAKLCLRKLMDGQTLYGTDQKIEPENYKDQKLSYINESKLEEDKFTFTIKNLSKIYKMNKILAFLGKFSCLVFLLLKQKGVQAYNQYFHFQVLMMTTESFQMQIQIHNHSLVV